MDIFSSLNPNQRQAVKSDGCVVVIAGPGTGKTKTLTSRIIYLTQQKKVSAQEILALTFTQKAAAEMKERLHNLPHLPNISTFHSLAFDILNNLNESTEIISEKERREILEIIQQRRSDKKLKSNIKDLSLLITRFKNEINNNETPSVITEYNKLLSERGLVDYDDLLLQLYHTLRDNNEKISHYKNRFSHILIDEFQDTNKLQYEIVKLLLKNNNLFVIGDPFQSIYSFRGAQSEIFKTLQLDFPNHMYISLDHNYRSLYKIIQASSGLFPESIHIKPISAGIGEVLLIKTINEYTEGEWIVEMINKKIGGTDLIRAGNISESKRELRFSDFAIIYRTHTIGKILEQKFIESGIPYQVIGGASLYEQPEISFIISLLQYIIHKKDLYLIELLYSPVLKLSSKSHVSLSRLFQEKKDMTITLLQQEMPQYMESPKDIQTVSTIISFIKSINIKAQTYNLLQLIHKIIEQPILKEFIAKHQHKEKNIHTFVSSITQFQDKPNSLEMCVKYFEFLKEHEFYDPTCDRVTLLTLHVSKGLEFKYVFICGFEDGIIPFLGKDVNMEEEKRLLYVGMTRAKYGLYLLQTRQRNKQQSQMSRFYPLISKFITEIDDEVIARRANQIKKWKEKKSQLQLF